MWAKAVNKNDNQEGNIFLKLNTNIGKYCMNLLFH